MRLPRRPVLLLVMVAPVLIMPACDYIKSSLQPNLRLRVKNEPPPSGLNCIDNVRLVDQTTQAEYCVLKTPDPTRQQTQLTCHTGPVTPSTSCDCGQDCGLTPGRKKRESERITGGSNVTGSCVHPWQVSLTMNVKSAVGRLLKLIEVYKEKLQVDITCPSCPSPPLGQITWYQYLTRELGALAGYQHYCGGTIISPNYAITAAKCLFWSRGIPDIRDWCQPPFTVCFQNLQLPEHLIRGLLFGGLHIPLLPEEITLLAGVNDLKTANNINMALFNSFKYDVEGIKIHENYNQFLQDVNAEFKEYDIAILTVKTPFRISNTVRPVCLPSSPTRDYTNEPAMATGFGDGTPLPLDQGSGEHLKKVNLKVVSTADCNTKWKAVRSDPNSYSHGPHDTLNYQNQDAIKGHHLCADAVGQTQDNPNGLWDLSAVCDGDEGGPLTVMENGRRTLIGIFSFADYQRLNTIQQGGGISCKAETPQVFTAVAPLVDWINENTKGRGSTPWNSNCQGHELGCVTDAHLRRLAGSG